MKIRIRVALCRVALALAFAIVAIAPAQAALNLETATIAELNAAFASGALTSERLVEAYLKRIEAYDKQGPTINAVITLNPRALAEARALDAERKAGKIRGPLHGIPIVLKDNYDTSDLQTTAGSQLLAGWVPPKDAYAVKKLRDAGAVILAKVNLSEFASGGSVGTPPSITGPPNGFSSMGGQTLNPHDLLRGPSGSSGGTGAAIAAVFAQAGMGSDTGGSIRGPSSVNGIVGLKPTNGLISRTGIVPLALTFDTGGPMARSVSDLAVMLGVVTGVDHADPLTRTSVDLYETDYTKYLKKGSLRGARIGIAREFMGRDAEVDRVTEEAIATLTRLGATIVDGIEYPAYVTEVRNTVFLPILNADFKAQLSSYFAHAARVKPGLPKSFAEAVTRAKDPAFGYRSPEKARGLEYVLTTALDQNDPRYLAARDQGLPFVRAGMMGVFQTYKLDAILYPTSARPAGLIAQPATPTPAAPGESPSSIANMTGFPDLIVPAGMTKDGLPVAISFFGPAYSEARLIGYAYDFEQATHARVLPKTTPFLPSDILSPSGTTTSAPLALPNAIDVTTATVPELEAAMAKGTLTAEKLTRLYLDRIAAYDKQGPTINAVITLNPKAIEIAKALDAERAAGKVRGPLHGIPIVLKDNIDTFDLPTTAGSQVLAGSIPPDDAWVARKLRDAGAIIVAKVNLSEWAGSGGSVSGTSDLEIIKAGQIPNGFSSMGGQTRNPHDLTRGPSGSSGGTGAAIASAFAQLGLGTDTGGSVRGPSSANGIVGLKPTHGLLSRDGIVPLALSFDTAGPMARSVTDVAIALGVMTGIDPADPATQKSAGKFETDYTKYLKVGALKGARIGIARDFMGKDPEVDRIVEQAIVTLKGLGAVIVDTLSYPPYLIAAKQPIYNTLVAAEFKAQLTDYLKTTKAGFPKSFDEVVALSNDPKTGYRSPGKAFGLKYNSTRTLDLTDPSYLAIKNEQLAAINAGIVALFTKDKLDAILYPTSPRPATPIEPAPPSVTGGSESATSFANETGFPDFIVPAGVTKDGLPVTISLLGQAFTEAKLIGYAFDFEQATHARVLPKNTPVLDAVKQLTSGGQAPR